MSAWLGSFSHKKHHSCIKHGFIEAEIREIFSVFFLTPWKNIQNLVWNGGLIWGYSRMSLCSRPLSKELLQEMRQFETKNPRTFLMVG